MCRPRTAGGSRPRDTAPSWLLSKYVCHVLTHSSRSLALQYSTCPDGLASLPTPPSFPYPKKSHRMALKEQDLGALDAPAAPRSVSQDRRPKLAIECVSRR
eukprot:306999-Prymnesium_polylepis.1